MASYKQIYEQARQELRDDEKHELVELLRSW